MKNNKQEDNPAPHITRPLIDSTLRSGVFKIIEDTHARAEYKLPPLSLSCLVMEFEIDTEKSQLFFSDTTVYISHKVCGRIYPLDKYVGILSVNNYNIAIFDENDIGAKYYNIDSLKMVPFDKFECYPLKSVAMLKYYIKVDTLNYWNP